MHKHPPPLVELSLDEGDGGNEMLKDVGIVCVVYVDLVPDESLYYSMS